jgi:hypothetical protein
MIVQSAARLDRRVGQERGEHPAAISLELGRQSVHQRGRAFVVDDVSCGAGVEEQAGEFGAAPYGGL